MTKLVKFAPVVGLDLYTFCRYCVVSDKIFLYREVDVVLKFLKEQCGAKRIGTVGFCWGGVATHYLSLQYPELKAGVSVYGKLLETKTYAGNCF